ncbi:MAG TPA: CehA/McbA family metallohydrolase [Polyangiales bacterium]|nr:CehA/McbA family metallohydrolase [Polyangiales bacterium]
MIALVFWIWREPSLASNAKPASTATLTLRVQDRSGNLLPARVRIAPRSFTARAFGQVSEMQRAIDGEDSQFVLAPGDYRVYVSHGPEWSLAELALHADAGAHVRRNVELEREIELPGWTASDLHVHTERSPDARGGVRALDLAAEGIALGVATDHNAIGDLGGEIDSLPGAEITTWQPEIGHFNAFPLQRLPRWRGTDPRALVRELTEDPRVFVQVNHPRLDDHIAYFALGGFDGTGFARADYHLNVHGLELWNGFDLARQQRVHGLLREWRRWLAQGHRLTATGGSDSHGGGDHLAGYPRTYVRAQRADELAASLRAGRAFVSNGPLLELDVEGKGPGETLVWRGDRALRVRIAVSAASWLSLSRLELWADEELVFSQAIPERLPGQPLRFSTRFSLPAGRTRVLSAVARGGSGLDRLLGRSAVEPLAFTNAVHLVRPAKARALHATR